MIKFLESDLDNQFRKKKVAMATRVSAVKEVLGLPALDTLLLEEHDDH